MATARDLIKNSLRLIGAIATGETPSASEIEDGLTSLTNMIDSWSNEKLTVPQIIREEFNLVGGQQSYTLGATGNFVSTRPVKIESAAIEIQSSIAFERELDIIDYAEWASLSDKSLQTSIPEKLYIEGSSPNSTLYFYPTPSEANKVVLYSRKQIASFTSVNDSVILPPGYMRALVYNLAIEIAPEYGKEPSASVVMIAREAKENIKRTNISSYIMSFDSVLTGCSGYDIEVDE
jgi:P22 tail accessory factor